MVLLQELSDKNRVFFRYTALSEKFRSVLVLSEK